MHVSSTFAAAMAAFAALAKTVQKREVGGILMCTGANSTGACKYEVVKMQGCNQLDEPFHQNITTFAPDGEGFYCYPYMMDCGAICTSPSGCTFGALYYDYPHKENLADIGWNNYMRSFRCYLNETSPGRHPKA